MGALQLWLDRKGYEQIVRQTYHSQQSIKRYVSTFLRIVVLHRKGMPEEEMAFLTRSSEKLVQDYLKVYESVLEKPHRREKLEEELERVGGGVADKEKEEKTPQGRQKRGEVRR